MSLRKQNCLLLLFYAQTYPSLTLKVSWNRSPNHQARHLASSWSLYFLHLHFRDMDNFKQFCLLPSLYAIISLIALFLLLSLFFMSPVLFPFKWNQSALCKDKLTFPLFSIPTSLSSHKEWGPNSLVSRIRPEIFRLFWKYVLVPVLSSGYWECAVVCTHGNIAGSLASPVLFSHLRMAFLPQPQPRPFIDQLITSRFQASLKHYSRKPFVIPSSHIEPITVFVCVTSLHVLNLQSIYVFTWFIPFPQFLKSNTYI